MEGKDVLEVRVAESDRKPICALDETGKAWAYVRIKDENILASPVHLKIWQHNRNDEKVIVTYSPREQELLTLLNQQGALTLNQCRKLTGMPRHELCRLLADFIRFELVEQVFRGHTFYFQLKETQ